MNAAREDANARDMFRARRRKSRVERGSGSDGLRDGGWTGRMGAGAPLLCEVDMSADRVRDLGRKCSLRDTGQTRTANVERVRHSESDLVIERFDGLSRV